MMLKLGCLLQVIFTHGFLEFDLILYPEVLDLEYCHLLGKRLKCLVGLVPVRVFVVW